MKWIIEKSKKNGRWYVTCHAKNGKIVAALHGGKENGYSEERSAVDALISFLHKIKGGWTFSKASKTKWIVK
jgi:uncharacterized protein YegP (UPF0339 family)